MSSVTTPTSRDYHEFIVARLQDPEDAASFLEAILQEDDPEPELLKNALSKAIEGLSQGKKVSESARQKYQHLNNLLERSGCEEIYGFVQLLQALGMQISIEVFQEDKPQT